MSNQSTANPDIVKLEGILHAIGHARYHANKPEHDITVMEAITYDIMIIGEICKKLSAKLKATHHDIPWKDIADMRNLLIHEYSKVSHNVVADVMDKRLPELEKQIQTILDTLEKT